MGGRLRTFSHQDLNEVSIVTYRGAWGGGASTNAFVASAPYAV